MSIINQKKVILVNNETSARNPCSSSGVYLTAVKLAQCRILNDNKIEKEKAKKERMQPPAGFVFNKIDLKIFINTNTACIKYCLHLNKPFSSASFPYHITPSRMHFYKLEVIWSTSQIKEGQK